ncbi:MAG: hypothetical protein ACE367_10965 [Acidimicrobiales bacterium]
MEQRSPTTSRALFADAAEVSALRDVVFRNRIDQAAPQVFRETYDE